MSERIEKIKLKLAESRQYLDAVLDQVGERWETRVYEDGEQWNVRQVIVHMADAERGIAHQVFELAKGNVVIPSDFDIQRYNQRIKAKMDGETVDEARAKLRDTRVKINEWLETVDDAAMDNIGRHPTLVEMPLGKVLRVQALHELSHANDIAHALDIHIATPQS